MAKVWIEEDVIKGACETIERLRNQIEEGETCPEADKLKSLVDELAEPEEESDGVKLVRTDI